MNIGIVADKSYKDYNFLIDFIKELNLDISTFVLIYNIELESKLVESFENIVIDPIYEYFENYENIPNEVIDKVDSCVIIWNGKNRYTKTFINKCVNQGKNCYIYNYKDNKKYSIEQPTLF